MMSEIHRFTRESVAKTEQVVANPDESADPERGGGFAEWAIFTLHAIRIERGKSYRQTIDLLSEMPGILEEIGLTRLPHYTVLHDWFETISMKHWRAFLRRSEENALAMLPSTPPASTATSPAATTFSERTIASAR